MSYIISINGSDGSGKTTQINLLRSTSKKNIFFTPDISSYDIFPKLPEKELFEWWFFKSDIEEFCKAIYQGIKYRNEEIERQDKPIVIMDKGIDTFESRILANFLCRGINEADIIKVMEAIKKQIGIVDNENMKLFLLTSQDMSERLDIAKRRKGTSFGQTYYDKYQKKLNEVLENQLRNNMYQIIDASGSIEKVNNSITRTIKQGLLTIHKVDKKDCRYER